MNRARRRFRSIWSSAALLIFIGSIFFKLRIFGYNGFYVAIFMWITGGIFGRMIFGSNNQINSKTRYTPIPVQYNNMKTTSQFCKACGSEFPITGDYCPECGTHASNNGGYKTSNNYIKQFD